MRNLVKAVAVVAALVPAMALAQIAGTRHDLSNANTTATTVSAATGGSDQTCIFCHTPHRGASQQLLWNRNAQTTAYNWGTTTATTGTTPLPTTLRPQSMACLSCHDGSISLGEVRNSSGAATTFTMVGNVSGTGALTGGYVVGAGGNLSGNHPISIAYPLAAGSNYFGNVSGVTSAAGVADFRALAGGAACSTPTGICTAHTAGANITIYADAATGGRGIECGSCHDVHNRFSGNTYFLRATTAGSAICLACHAK